ncbi:hypothetical protein EDB83DRAFT_2313290 [Lactarius deliciosus]|nr:hypothetical protein EDB83DRAFT_2313290 [Lactarius deliciosus]
MAVTVHWIEEQAEDTLDGPRKKLVLHSALIGFHVVPKGHDGKQLAHILFSIVESIGWITMDNASNNNTMMVAFADEDLDITAVVHDDYAPINDFGEVMSKDPIAVICNVSISSYLLNEPVLQSYHLSDEEWNALEVCKKILSVPHSFQQCLLVEKTLTLCHAIPSFQAMCILWSRQKTEMPHASAVIDEGFEKLAHYEARMSAVPAYILAMILNPTMKLHWFKKNMPSQVPRVKQMFLDELCLYKPTESSDFGSPFCGDDDWAANLLGLGSAQLATTSGSEWGVEAKFNAYLFVMVT